MATQEYKAGDVLIAEGHVPEAAFRIITGSVELARAIDGLSAPTAVLDRGALVGADEFLDGQAMADTAQALGNLKVEILTLEQTVQLLGRKPSKAQATKRRAASEKPQKTQVSPSKALVALSAQADTDYSAEDPASTVLKPGLLRRLLKPEFADIHDRIDVRVAEFSGINGEQATQHLVSEFNKRRGLRAKPLNAQVALEPGGDPVRAMRELRKVCDRWLIDNGGDVLVWGQVAPSGSIVHIRFFVRDNGVIDPFRIGDGWSLLVLPQPLDISGAHRIHAAVLAAVRSKAAGKLLTVKRDLEVLMADARDHLVAETANLDPLESAEDKLARARIFANTMRFKRRADDAKTALALIDSALTVFSAEQTPIEWALAHKDRAFLGQFIAERTNDTDALRASMQDVEAALTILRPSLFPQDWAVLNDRLGLALYRLDFDNGDTATLERALQAFHDALSVYDRQKTPSEWAEAMGHFGQVALVIGRETRNPKMLLRAIEACNAVVGVRDRKHTPMHWASAQNNLGSAMFLYGRIAGDTGALRGARDAFRTAHQIYIEKGADRLARVTEKNMRHVDTALTRKPRPEPPSLPWEPEGNQPPSLPWEFDSPNRSNSGSSRKADNDDVWLDDRLR